ncbi:MAG: anti-sigma factor family protein [Bdellovibrionota bacterium]
MMDCFQWQSHASEFIDGSLGEPLGRLAEAHLDGCKECKEHHQHYRLILTSIAGQARKPLPAPLRAAPLSAILPRPELARSRWERIPWYLRTTLEGMSIVLVILIGISAGPRVRRLYERSIEKSLSEFSETFSVSDSSKTDASLPLVPVGATAGAAGDEFSGESEEDVSAEEDDSVETDGDIRVGSSEIWRFNLRTDSPDELIADVSQVFKDLHVAADAGALGGLKIPGGIQFDLLVNKNIVPGLKRSLQKIAPKSSEISAMSPTGETFTWYRIKSRRKIPPGKTRVVIWLSQI